MLGYSCEIGRELDLTWGRGLPAKYKRNGKRGKTVESVAIMMKDHGR